MSKNGANMPGKDTMYGLQKTVKPFLHGTEHTALHFWGI